MINIIQAARGAFEESENFETGESWLTDNNFTANNTINNGREVSDEDQDEEDSFYHVAQSPKIS